MDLSLDANDCGRNIDVKKFDELKHTKTVSIQPMYITVGPPCSGKTTWIRNQSSAAGENSYILDICLDDQPGIYYSLITDHFILLSTNISTTDNINPIMPQSLPHPSSQIFGRTLQERVNEQEELLAVVRRFTGTSTKDDFRRTNSNPLLLDVVEDVIAELESNGKAVKLPATIDIYVMEAIFRCPSPIPTNTLPHNTDGGPSLLTSLQRMKQVMYDTPLSIPIAYGNTNTRPSDYIQALQVALDLQRPVHFVVYSGDDKNEHAKTHCDLSVENGLLGLIRRNVYRFLQTGRYIPVQVISDMRDRTNSMINDIKLKHQQRHLSDSISPPSVVTSNEQLLTMTKLEFHQQLAKLAGFSMDDNRIITSRIRNPPLSANSNRDVRGSVIIAGVDNPNNGDIDRRQQQMNQPPTLQSTDRQRTWERPTNARSSVRGYHATFSNHPNKRAR